MTKRELENLVSDEELLEIQKGAAKMFVSAEENMIVFDKMLKLLLKGGRIKIVAEITYKTFVTLTEAGFDPEKALQLTPHLVRTLIDKLPTVFI